MANTDININSTIVPFKSTNSNLIFESENHTSNNNSLYFINANNSKIYVGSDVQIDSNFFAYATNNTQMVITDEALENSLSASIRNANASFVTNNNSFINFNFEKNEDYDDTNESNIKYISPLFNDRFPIYIN